MQFNTLTQKGDVMKRYYFLIFLIVALLMGNADAATFNVSTQTALQDALTAAASNGQNDVINVSAGTLTLTSNLSYSPADTENYTLTIRGAGSGLTILDGNSQYCIMILNAILSVPDNNAHLAVSGITFQNGYTSA